MKRRIATAALALLVALASTGPALAQHHFHGGPRFRGPFFGGGIFFPPFPYGYYVPAYPLYPYPTSYAWYCPNPPGYYPYVGQCAVAWVAVPAG